MQEIAELTLFFATIYHVLFSAVWILSNTSYLNYLNEKLDVDPVDLTVYPYKYTLYSSHLNGDRPVERVQGPISLRAVAVVLLEKRDPQ